MALKKLAHSAALGLLFIAAGCTATIGQQQKELSTTWGRCFASISTLTDHIEQKGGTIININLYPSEDSPHSQRVSALTVSLASSESVGVSVSGEKAESNRRIANDVRSLMPDSKNIMEKCSNIASVGISMHEIGSTIFMDRDGSLKEEECIDIEQQASWGKRICT